MSGSAKVTEEDSPEGGFYFHYDEACDLLGGASWEHGIQNWLLSGELSSDRHHRLEAVAGLFSSSNQFLFSADPAGCGPLERLWLKWNLFKSLCNKVRRLHKECKRPMLNIQPAHVRVVIPDRVGDFLPARWQFSIIAEEREPPSPFVNPRIPPERVPCFYNAPRHPHRIYSSPILQERPLGYSEIVTVLIRSMERIREPAQEGVQGIIEVQLISENIRSVEYSETDVFCVILRFPDAPDLPMPIWATKVASLERGLLLKGITEPVPLPFWEKMEKARQNVFSHSTVMIYKTYHVPCDLYSLGMMLLRTLLVNDERDMPSVEQAARHIAGGLEPMVQGLDPEDPTTLSLRFQTRLEKENRSFSKEAVLYSHEERKMGYGIIPCYIWYDTLILAFRLITSIPGFSFCKNHGDYEIENLQGPMEKVVCIVERLERWMRIELFGSRPRNREILKACDLVRKEWIAGTSQ